MTNNYTNRQRILRNATIGIITCLFFVNTISLDYLSTSKLTKSNSTLQVQSIFNPIIDMAGKEYETQIKTEVAAILAMVLREKDTPSQDLGIMLDEWYSARTDMEKRILKALSVSREEKAPAIVDVELAQGPQKGTRFRITSNCKTLGDIQGDEKNIRIERISAKDNKRQRVETLIKELPPRNIDFEIDELDIIKNFISNLQYGSGEWRVESAEEIKYLIQAGLLRKREIRERLPLDNLVKALVDGLVDVDVEVRVGSAKAMRLLIEIGLFRREDFEKNPDLEKNAIKLKETVLDLRRRSAETIKYLIKAGLVKKETIGNISLQELIQCLSAGSEEIAGMLIGPIRHLIEAGLTEKKDFESEDLLKGLTKGLGASIEETSKESAKLLKYMVGNKLIDKSSIEVGELIKNTLETINNSASAGAISIENIHVIYTAKNLADAHLIDKKDIKHYPFFVEGLVAGLDSKSGKIRIKSAEAIKVLVKAKLITRESLKKKLFVGNLIEGIKNGDMHERASNIEATTHLLEAKVVFLEEAKRKDLLAGVIDNEAHEETLQAIKALNEAGLIKKEEIKTEGILGRLIDNLGAINEKIRSKSAEVIKSFVDTGHIAPHEIGRLYLTESRRIFKEVHSKTLSRKLELLYTRLLKNTEREYSKIIKLGDYLTQELFNLSQIDHDIFCEHFVRIIKEEKTPHEAEKEITEVLQREFTRKIQEANITNHKEFAWKLGKVLAHVFKKERRINKYIASAFRVFGLDFKDGAETSVSASGVAEACLQELPAMNSSPLPIEPPVFVPKKNTQIHKAKKEAFLEVLKDAEIYKIAGRTIIYKNKKGEYIALKFRKKNGKDYEDSGKLIYESAYFNFLNNLVMRGKLKSDYPLPALIDGERAVRITEKELPNMVIDSLNKAKAEIKEANAGFTIAKEASEYTVMAYKTRNSDYFTYLHEIKAKERVKAQVAFQKNISDLFTLARCGLIHPDIIELFHDYDGREVRGDEGRYLWMVDTITTPTKSTSGAGDLLEWENAVKYPNMRVSGLADFSEMIQVKDLIGLDHPHVKHAQGTLQRFPEEKRSNIILASFMGDYLLAWALIEGKRLKRENNLDWENCQGLAEIIKKQYTTAQRAFTLIGDNDVQELIDWDMFARQMAFFMSGAYKNYVKKDIPEEITGISGLRIIPGDGWGHIHKDVIEEKIKEEKELLQDVKPFLVIRKYLKLAESTGGRPMPKNVFVFNPDFTKLIKNEKNNVLAKLLTKLYAEYSKGWRWDGKNDDLGPCNGPNPLQELIKANYIYTTAMIGRQVSSDESANLMEPETPSIANLLAGQESRGDPLVASLKEVAMELERSIPLDGRARGQLAEFYRKYVALKNDLLKGKRSLDNKYLMKCFSAERIADMFYLKEVYEFDIFGLLSDKRETQWIGQTEKGKTKYLFKIMVKNAVEVREVFQKKESVLVGRADGLYYNLDKLDIYRGKNIGSFIIKARHFLLWTQDKKRKGEVGISTRGGEPLLEYYNSIGFSVNRSKQQGQMDLFGGLDAGILTKEQAEKIKGLDKRIWRVWSQRKLDRYFKLTKQIESRMLVEANRAFAETHKNDDISILREITPEEVTEFIRGYVEEIKNDNIAEEIIESTNARSLEALRTIKRHLEATTDKVDIAIDLSLIPREDQEENIKTWARLIALCRDLKNVNFVFKLPYNVDEENMSESLLKDVENAAKGSEVISRLKEEISTKAELLEIDPAEVEPIRRRIKNSVRKGAIEISILSKAWLEWRTETKEKSQELEANQYPVALDESSLINGETALRNFEAALTIGLAKAALVIAEKRDQEEGEKESSRLKEDLLNKLQKLYAVFREDVVLTEKTLDGMIHPSPTVRINLAISLALPPVTRMYFDKLVDLHEGIQFALQAA